MLVSIIVAVAQNNVIGKDNELAWRLPNDLKYFKSITTAHPVIMGRVTYESIGKPLPNRTNIIVTRNNHLEIEGCICVTTIQAAVEAAKNTGAAECFVIGGAEIYKQSLHFVDKIYLTEVKAEVDGNVFFEFDKNQWQEESRKHYYADEKHAFDYSFVELYKK